YLSCVFSVTLFVFPRLRRALSSTLFPYTTLFRSRDGHRAGRVLRPAPRAAAQHDRGTFRSARWRDPGDRLLLAGRGRGELPQRVDRKSTRLNSSHVSISYAVFCLKKKKKVHKQHG